MKSLSFGGLAIGVLARFDTLFDGAYVVQGYLSAIESRMADRHGGFD